MSYAHHPRIEREKVYKKANRLRILLSPIFLIMYLFLFFVRLFGQETTFFRFVFGKRMKQFKKMKEAGFRGYTPVEKDVFACCYSKSGTNWLLMIVYQIISKGNGDFGFIHDVVPWPHSPVKGLAVPIDHEMANDTSTGLRLIKCNAELTYVPYDEKAKYICLLRDPKSTCVSAYYFVKSALMGPLMPSVETFVNLFLSDRFMAGDWAFYAKEYWEWRNRPNVYFITYETLKDDLAGNIHKLADFLGVDLTKEEYKRINYLSSYDYMKGEGHKFAVGRIFPLGEKNSEIVRTGKKNNSGELLSKAQQDRIDDFFRQRLVELGSDFPYVEMYSKQGQHIPA